MHHKLQGARGIVKSNRWLAIRVQAGTFEPARKALLPYEPLKLDIGPASGLHDDRLSPAPIAATYVVPYWVNVWFLVRRSRIGAVWHIFGLGAPIKLSLRPQVHTFARGYSTA